MSNDKTLDVYLGKHAIAKLMLDNDELQWHYAASWQQAGFPMSPHLPLQGDISATCVQRFIRNLFPEGNGFEELLSLCHVSKSNTFALIRALGHDTPGALTFLAADSDTPATSFRSLTDTELAARLDARDSTNLIAWDGKPRLSVAGIQDKINVVVDSTGQLGFGEGELCSSHILKFEPKKLMHLVLNEYFTMQLAQRCGLAVAKVELRRFGRHPGLLVERFDRQLIAAQKVKRRHIIDGCQALNLPPEYKYERNFGSGRDVMHIREGASLEKLFAFAASCENPARTKQDMLDWLLFNILVFNCDAHAKNISFFVTASGLALAPFYDLVNVKMYPEFEQDLAMALGDEFDENNVHAYQLADFADTCKLPRAYVAQRLGKLAQKLLTAIVEPVKLDLTSEENDYLVRYKQLVASRCEHLLSQVDAIRTIDL